MVLGSQKLRAPFDNVSQYFADGSIGVLDNHRIGIQFFSDRIGEVNEDLQFNLRYAYTVFLKENYSLTLGAFAGVLNSVIRSSISKTTGSAFALNASSSVTFEKKQNWQVNCSFNQFTEPVVRPLYDAYVFPRYFVGNMSKNLFQDNDVRIKPFCVFYNSKHVRFLEPGLEAHFLDHFLAGLSVRNSGLASIKTSITGIKISDVNLDFLFNYNWQLFNQNGIGIQYFTFSLMLASLK